MKRKCCLLPAVLLCLMLLPISRVRESGVEQARQSVVHLYGMGTDTETGAHSRWTGTGFAVGISGENSDIFLTNWHVATGGGKYADGQVELWLLRDNAGFDRRQRPLSGSAVKCRVLITTGGYPDVAVIQAMEPVEGYKALPLLSSRRAKDGARVYALGFPGLKGSRYGTDSGAEDVSVTSGEIRDHLAMTQAGNTMSLIHTAAIRHGFSGGPLVNEQGIVVAQNTYGFEKDVSTDLFCAVYIDYGMELLDRLNIPYTTAKGPWVIAAPASVIAAAGAAALAAFGLYFIQTTRRAAAEGTGKHAPRRSKKEDKLHEN